MPEEAHVTFSRVIIIKDLFMFLNLKFYDFYRVAFYAELEVTMPLATLANN